MRQGHSREGMAHQRIGLSAVCQSRAPSADAAGSERSLRALGSGAVVASRTGDTDAVSCRELSIVRIEKRRCCVSSARHDVVEQGVPVPLDLQCGISNANDEESG